jgi:DNA-binding transcriptional MerR regulator
VISVSEPNKTFRELVNEATPTVVGELGGGYYRVPALKQLAEQQVRFALADHRQQRMLRAERLFAEVEASRHYPYQYVYYRVTDFRTEDHPNLVISGDDLKHDLWLLIDQLAKSLPRLKPAAPVEMPAEPVLTLEQISEQFNVSTKTISRWRDRGLVGRRILLNGRWQLGFPQSVVDRFLSANHQRVERSRRFSLLSEEEKADILRRAKRLARVGLSTLTEVSRRIAHRLGRSPETVRYTIKNFDREHPDQAIFRLPPGNQRRGPRPALSPDPDLGLPGDPRGAGQEAAQSASGGDVSPVLRRSGQGSGDHRPDAGRGRV